MPVHFCYLHPSSVVLTQTSRNVICFLTNRRGTILCGSIHVRGWSVLKQWMSEADRCVRRFTFTEIMRIYVYICFCPSLQGLNIVVPVVDSIKYVQSLKEIAIDIPLQSAITAGQFSIPAGICCIFLIFMMSPPGQL